MFVTKQRKQTANHRRAEKGTLRIYGCGFMGIISFCRKTKNVRHSPLRDYRTFYIRYTARKRVSENYPPHYKILIFNQLHVDSFVYTIYLCSWPTKTNSIECLGEPITYHPWSRRGKSSLSQGRSSDSFPPLRLPSLKPVAKSARSCPIRAETHSNGYCRRFSLHSLFVSGHRIIPGKPCDAKLENYFIKILK